MIDFNAVNDYNDSNFGKDIKMSVITVRNLDPDVKTRLRVAAAEQGIAMEEAVRRILTKAVNEAVATPLAKSDLGSRIQARFSGLGGLVPAPRSPVRPPPFSAKKNA
jgi:plasmid stability protein